VEQVINYSLKTDQIFRQILKILNGFRKQRNC
jgi:hypothetical protein